MGRTRHLSGAAPHLRRPPELLQRSAFHRSLRLLFPARARLWWALLAVALAAVAAFWYMGLGW